MGLLGELYGLFGLAYSIALIKLKHDNPSRTDKAIIIGTAAFLVLSFVSFLNQFRLIPRAYKLRFLGKSLLRGLFAPLLWLFHHHVLFYSKGWVRRAFTFSNEAYDGVERTRQTDIFELVPIGAGARYNLKPHALLRYDEEGKWGYDRLVGDIWVRVRFEDIGIDDTVQYLELGTSAEGVTSLTQYTRDPANARPPPDNPGVKVSCLECVCGDLERGYIPEFPGTDPIPLPLPPPPAQYRVTITRRRAICRIQRRGCCPRLCPGCRWNLKCTVVQRWTLFQIHQYMLCLDTWGNHPKQGIWKPKDVDTQRFRYCYRHDELINNIGDNTVNRRLLQTRNNGIWYTVV